MNVDFEIFGGSGALMFTSRRLTHLEKAPPPISFRLTERVAVASRLHSRKASLPISFTAAGMVMFCRATHFSKALLPMLSSVMGRVIDCSAEHSWKAFDSIFLIETGRVIDFGKAYILDTVDGPVVKYIAPGSDDEHLTCISANKDPRFAQYEVLKEDILGMYLVVMCMKMM